MNKNPFDFSFNGRELIDYDRYVSPTGKEILFLDYQRTEMTPKGIYVTYKERIIYPALKSGIQPKSPEDIRECTICGELFTKEDTVECNECGIIMCKDDAEFIDEDTERIWLCPDHMSKRSGLFTRFLKSLLKS